jgi:hypothetical protein
LRAGDALGLLTKISHLSNPKIVQLTDAQRTRLCYTLGKEQRIMNNSSNQPTRLISYSILGLLCAVGAGLGVGIVTHSVVVGLLLGIGVALGALLLLVLIFGSRSEYQTSKETNYMGVGIAIGAGLGVAYGVILGLVLDNPAFFSIGISIGVGTGVSIGAALNARNEQHGA